MLTAAEARKGEVVTTTNRYGGLEIGYLIAGQVWQTTGTFHAVKAEDNVLGMIEYTRDEGASYMAKARSLIG
jgi:hypothetical protein